MHVAKTPKPDPFGPWIRFTGEELDLYVIGVAQSRNAKGLVPLEPGPFWRNQGDKKRYDRKVIPLSHINEQAEGYTLSGPA